MTKFPTRFILDAVRTLRELDAADEEQTVPVAAALYNTLEVRETLHGAGLVRFVKVVRKLRHLKTNVTALPVCGLFTSSCNTKQFINISIST